MPQIDQTEPYYELHRNYPDRYKCRTARRLGIPATTLAAWYAVMHDIASNAGRFGEFTTDVRAFEEAVGEPERHGTSLDDVERDAKLASYWRIVERAGLCEIVDGQPEPIDGLEGIPTTFRVRVLGTATRPRRVAMTDAERARRYRERNRSDDDESSRNVTSVTDPRDASQRHVTSRGSIQSSPSSPSIHKGQSSVVPSLPRTSARTREAAARTELKLTGLNPKELDSSTEYELDRLLGDLRDADEGTRGVLVHLARRGARAADFADARAAIRECTPLKPAAYAVTTITNRIGGAA